MSTKRRIGIIAAMDEEIDKLKEKMKSKEIFEKAGMEFVFGELIDVPVVAVRCGIGKVNAATCTQALADNFNITKLINTGVAGSLDRSLHIGDVVVSTDLIQYDMDVTAFGYKLGQIPRMDVYSFVADKELIDTTIKACEEADINHKVITGRIISGDKFVNDSKEVERLSTEFEAKAVEMESAAIAHVCHINNIPFVAIRSISDDADDNSNISFEQFEHMAAENSANIVLNILKHF